MADTLTAVTLGYTIGCTIAFFVYAIVQGIRWWRSRSGRAIRVHVEVPAVLGEALLELSPDDAWEALKTYTRASPEEQEAMLEFLRSGREKVRQVRLEHEEGIPSADRLRQWLEGGDEGEASRG